MLGLAQWFAILCRPSFSTFHRCYAFVRLEPTEVAIDVPANAEGEFLCFALLAPLLGAALDALIIAPDAAPEYGFGVSVAQLPSSRVAELGRKSDRQGGFVRINRDGHGLVDPERTRLGRPVSLLWGPTHFRDIISKRASRLEQSGVLELRGVRMGPRWALRLVHNHGKSFLLFVDAKAAIYAIGKGRSGAFSFRQPLASFGALSLATGCTPRCLYILSEDNPADAPSRRKRARPSGPRRQRQPRHFFKFLQTLHKFSSVHVPPISSPAVCAASVASDLSPCLFPLSLSPPFSLFVFNCMSRFAFDSFIVFLFSVIVSLLPLSLVPVCFSRLSRCTLGISSACRVCVPVLCARIFDTSSSVSDAYSALSRRHVSLCFFDRLGALLCGRYSLLPFCLDARHCLDFLASSAFRRVSR